MQFDSGWDRPRAGRETGPGTGRGEVWGDPAHLDPASHCFLGRQHGVPKPSHCPHNNHCEPRTSGYSQHLPRAYHCPVSQMKCQRLREGTADPVSQPGRGSSRMQTHMLSAPDPSPGPGLPQCSKKGAPTLAHPPAGRPLAQPCPGLASKEAPGSERNRDYREFPQETTPAPPQDQIILGADTPRPSRGPDSRAH